MRTATGATRPTLGDRRREDLRRAPGADPKPAAQPRQERVVPADLLIAGALASPAMSEPAPKEGLDARDCITAISVSDVAKSRAWYSQLLGREPDLEPYGNLEWKVAGGWISLQEGEPKPSPWQLHIEVRDVSREHARVKAAGISAKDVQTEPGELSFFIVKDPDNYTLLFFQVLSKDPKITGRRTE